MLTDVSAPTIEDLRQTAHRAVTEPPATGDAVGLEVEAFAMEANARRVAIGETADRLDRLGMDRRPGIDPTYRTRRAVISFEPGGQVEVSTDPAATISEAIDAQLTTWRSLSDIVAGGFAFCGLDVWNNISQVPLQLAAPRYRAMDTYLGMRTPAGRVMMRHTCSVQINLDGGGPIFDRRLEVAQAIAPFITAAFASSPTRGAHSGRARIWQQLDPTRTGFLDTRPGAAEAIFAKALAADVLVVRRDDIWHPGIPGMSFSRWVENGHPVWGPPGVDDLAYHLTTLFPEVRARRGTIEIRTPDSLPLRLLPALVVLVSGAVYVSDAGAEILELATSEDPADLWRRAALRGMGDPIIAGLARRIWNVALLAASSLSGSVRQEHLRVAQEYVTRYVDRRWTPSDDIRAALVSDPVRALQWVAASEE